MPQKLTDQTYVLNNPVVQDFAVSVDTPTDRMTLRGNGCTDPKAYYWLYLKDKNGKTLTKNQISFQSGFGNVLVEKLAVGSYQV